MAKKKKIQEQKEKKPKSGIQDQIAELEKELSKTKYNKKTQHHIGLLKAKIAVLKEKDIQRRKGGKKGEGYAVRKTGDATVVILGFPSVGKSTLLNALTNADSPVAHYDFTTLNVIPGLLEYNSAKIQILDVPGIVSGAASGRGRGKEVLQIMRNSDLVLIMVDVFRPKEYKHILKEVYDTNVRLNQTKPDVKITKIIRGGIRIGKTVRLKKMDDTDIKNILREFKIANADVLIRSEITMDQFIDVIEGNKHYAPSVVVLNKVDMASDKQILNARKLANPDLLVSAKEKTGIDELKELIFQKLEFIRIYLKQVRKPADMKEPLIMFKGCTVKDVCEKLHKDFVTKFKFARLWGKSAKFDGQKFLNIKKELQDEDVLEVHLR